MTILEYQQKSKRTFPSIGSYELDLLHTSLGVYTEVGEFLDQIKKHIAYGKQLDKINLQEEISDINFYIVNEATLNDEPLNYDSLHLQSKSPYSLKDVSYDIKSWLNDYYGVDDSIGYFELISGLYSISQNLGLDFFQGLENNVNKLLIRFPDGFNKTSATIRDLESERTELSKGFNKEDWNDIANGREEKYDGPTLRYRDDGGTDG